MFSPNSGRRRYPEYDEALVSQTASTTLDTLIKHNQLWLLASVGGATVLAWLDLLSMATGIEAMENTLLSAQAVPRASADFSLIFIMWAIIMVGMMLPIATPMILLYTTINRSRRHHGKAATPRAVFPTWH